MWAGVGIVDLSYHRCHGHGRRVAGRPGYALAAGPVLGLLLAAGECAAQGPAPAGTTVIGPLAVWLATAVALAAALTALALLSRWIRRYPLRDLVLVALTTGMAFLLVSVPGFLLRSLTAMLLGPFSFLVEGLIFKLVLFLLLGNLFALVRRPGVFFLFFGLWTVAQALLNGHFAPMMVLFSASTVCIVESALWLSGITRPAHADEAPSWLKGAIVVGLAEGVSVFWSLQLIQVLFRVHLADWFVLFQAGTEAIYAGLGLAIGLRLGTRLRATRRPQLAAGDLSPPEGGTARTWQEASSGGRARRAPLLEIHGLSYAYPGAAQPLLRNLRLRVEAGEIVLLAGPSGAGKTTLLRLVQGLLPWPGQADLRFEGGDAAGLSPRRRAAHSGLLFQEPALQVVRSTVAGEVAFGHELLHGAAAGVADPVREALSLFGLDPLAQRRTGTLSGGELQRTALAALVAAGPRLLLLDEPLAHLDEGERGLLLEHLQRLAAAGLGIVVAEHRTEALLPLAHRVMWLQPGSVPWQGLPQAFRLRRGQSAPPIARARPAAPGQDGPATLAEMRGVVFRHGDAAGPVIRGLDALLRPGHAVALTGANGSGKTTLLSLLLGLARPQQGTVMVHGRTAHRLRWAQKARLFGYLPQQAELLLHAPTAAEELGFALRCRGAEGQTVDQQVQRWLERIGLAEMAGRNPHLLSRGEKQRLALASIMVSGPAMLVLDEPFAGQDARHANSILELCHSYLREDASRSLIAATHELSLVEGFFHQRWHLADGKLSVTDMSALQQAAGLAAAGGGA